MKPPESRTLRFLQRLQKWVACPNLMSSPETSVAQPAPRPAPNPGRWPKSESRKAQLGGGVKLAVRSANSFCSASVRVADLGLLFELEFRVSNYGLWFESDRMPAMSWLLKPDS